MKPNRSLPRFRILLPPSLTPPYKPRQYEPMSTVSSQLSLAFSNVQYRLTSSVSAISRTGRKGVWRGDVIVYRCA